jgi:hypothetical protein
VDDEYLLDAELLDAGIELLLSFLGRSLLVLLWSFFGPLPLLTNQVSRNGL